MTKKSTKPAKTSKKSKKEAAPVAAPQPAEQSVQDSFAALTPDQRFALARYADALDGEKQRTVEPPPPSDKPLAFGNQYYDTPAELAHAADAIQIMTLLMSENVVQFDTESWGEDWADGFMMGVRLIAGALHRIDCGQIVLRLAKSN